MDERLDYISQKGNVREITISRKGSFHVWTVKCLSCGKTETYRVEKEKWMFWSFMRRTHAENAMMGRPCPNCNAK